MPVKTHSNTSALSHRRSAGGFTLLEVMIALVVLSIGLLGVAALQGVGLRSSHGAYLTSQASLLAYDMADRIRANPQTIATYHGFESACPEEPPDTPLAAADLAEWSCALVELLPQGEGRITGVENAVTRVVTYTITVEWQDLQADTETPWSFSMVVDI